MTRKAPRAGARARLPLLIGGLLLGAAGLAFVADRPRSPQPATSATSATPATRPPLMLLTSLPLVFGEQFGLESTGSAALSALETRYRVVPVDTAARSSLGDRRLLLMAHPHAQTAEALVELDAWVRGGGRLLLLADPALEWHSEQPLGSMLRPPPAFADTGLLRHWGLRLDAPDERGPKLRRVGGREVATSSPGTLGGSGCRIGRDALVARCRIGRGQVTVIADADFIDVGRPEGLDGPTDDNLPALLDELAALQPG